ncbi:family 31 glycosyltransferase [Thozetella sp. PMI_491]|nr:family 31 glycosyltransferase [Thozetella sp. PMI_491]
MPYDHSVVLFFRFASNQAVALIPGQNPGPPDNWIFRSPKFPVDLDHDVSFVTKTGYGTQFRVPAQLEALGFEADDSAQASVLVIADFATRIRHDGKDIQVHDVIASMAQSGGLGSLARASKLEKYANMSAAIRSGNRERAISLSKEVGWELDALKFIPGLELAHRKMPGRKWYVMLDDDTYILKPNLRAMLGQLDPSKPLYLGNPVGDFKGRFAHGGSSIVLSGAVMRLLFDDNAPLVSEAYARSVEETWGDKLVATTLMKIGVYLDERHGRFFNGERPRIARIAADRFCSPIVAFHGLADTRQMTETMDFFSAIQQPLVWSELWNVYDQTNFNLLESEPIMQGEDHVGRTDESSTTVLGVNAAVKCADLCEQRHDACLAWTWDKATESCHMSPWMIVGEEKTGFASGLNVALVMRLLSQCSQ